MVGHINPFRKLHLVRMALVACVLLGSSTYGQIFKKKSKKKEREPASYAYQTFSTTQPKEKKLSLASGEGKFHFEKPLQPVPFEKIDRIVDYSKAPYFGHKRPPHRRPVGSTRLCKVCGIKH